MRMLRSKLKVLLIVAGLFPAGVTADAQSLKVPFAALSPTYAPLWIADRAGFFKKHGLDVQLLYISAGSVIIPAILSGQVDVANMSSAPALRVVAWCRAGHSRRDIESIAARRHGPGFDQEA